MCECHRQNITAVMFQCQCDSIRTKDRSRVDKTLGENGARFGVVRCIRAPRLRKEYRKLLPPRRAGRLPYHKLDRQFDAARVGLAV